MSNRQSAQRKPRKKGPAPSTKAITLDDLAKRIALLDRPQRSLPPPAAPPAPVGTPVTLASAPGTLEQVGREADMAWSGVKRIMSLLNVENKHVYYNASGNAISQAGSVLDLCSLISQGVGGNQRVGDSLKILRVRVKAQITLNTSGNSRQAVTFVLGHSKDGVPAVADVFAVVSNATSGLAFPADTYQQADKWSAHRTLTLAYASGTSITDRFSEFVEFNQKFGHDVLYTNASTTTASGNVWLAYISNEPTNFPLLDLAVDIEFVDN